MGRRPKASTQATEIGENAQGKTTKVGTGTGNRIVALQRTQQNETATESGSAAEKQVVCNQTIGNQSVMKRT